MRFLLISVLFTFSLYGGNILVVNSNGGIEKYKSVENSFKESFEKDFNTIDLSKMSRGEIKEYLYDEYPDIVYTIGAKAYQYVNNIIPEKTIFFSSIVNYKRLKVQKNRYGVSNELHSGMELTLIKSLFSNYKKLGIVYSKYTNNLFESYKSLAKQMDIEIVGQKISKSESVDRDLLKECDGFVVISDPVLLKNKDEVESIFEIMKDLKKPIFAYHELFVKYGASLIVSVDNPTIGRQVASMINIHLDKKEFDPIQLPMGTNVVFNKKHVDNMGLQYNKFALSVINKVIE